MYRSKCAVFVKNFSSKTARKPSVYKALSHFCFIITQASILRTIPVAFIIYNNLLDLQICTVRICKTRSFILSQKVLKFYLGLRIVKLSPNAPTARIRSIMNGAV